MADIQIIIGYETVKQADQAFKILDKTVKSTARQYEQAFNKITGWQKKFSNEQNKVNASLNTQHLAQQKSNKSARDSAKAFEDVARAAEKNAASLKSMRMATDAVYRKQQKRLQMKKLLKAAVVAETMTTEQAIVALKKYNAAQMSSNKVMNMAKNRMNGNNMAIQQLGYQFGDFAVQVQGGTSAFVAFSQQGAQLAGILPMIAGPLGLTMGAAVGLSAALGIIIPIVGAVGRLLFETGNKSKEAAEKMKSSWEDVPSYFDSIGANLSDTFDVAFDKIEGRYSSLIRSFEEAKLKNLKNSLPETVGVGDTRNLVQKFLKVGEVTGVEALMTGDDNTKTLDDSEAINKISNAYVESAKNANSLQEILDLGRDASAEILAINKDVGEEFLAQLNSVGLIEAARNSDAKTQRELSNAAKEEQDRLQQGLENLTKRSTEWTRSMSAGYAVSQGVAQSQRDNFSTAEETLRLSTQDLSLKLKVKDELDRENVINRRSIIIQRIKGKLTVAQAQTLLELTGEFTKQQKLIRENVEETKALEEATKAAAQAMKSLSDFGGSIEKKLIMAEAKLQALKDGGDAANASMAAGLEYELKLRHEIALAQADALGDMGLRLAAQNAYNESLANLAKLKGVQGQIAENTPSSSSSSGPKENAFEKLKKETDRRRDLLKMSEAQATVTKGVWKLEDSLGKDRAKYSKENIEALVKRGIVITENERLAKEAADQQKELSNSITGAMETGFMAMIDGTMSVKDAFKQMAAAIIKELLYIMVVKKAVAAITGFFGFADGGAFSGGSEIKAYADGGVVGGPTTFPMAGGKTGLMGEAGPEAIMPLKRGANGKLGVQMEGSGGGDTYVTNNHYSISANTSEDTKRLVTQTIQQATPTITANTKASIMNDRRRGGQMKSVFG